MKIITNNSYFRLANHNINPIILNKFTFKIIDKMEQIFAFFYPFLPKIAVEIGDYHFV